MITFLYLYDGGKLHLKLVFRSQKLGAVGATIMFDAVRS